MDIPKYLNQYSDMSQNKLNDISYYYPKTKVTFNFDITFGNKREET